MSASLVVATRILTELRRSRRVLALWIVFPAAMLLLFGSVRAARVGIAEAFTASAPGILIGAGLFFSCLGGPVAVLVAERERHTLRRLLTAPLSAHAYFVGVLVAHLAIAAAQTVLVYGITVGVGGGFRGSVVVGAGILALSVMAYVGIGFLVAGSVARSAEDVNGAVAGIGVPLLVLGGTFFPSDDLPGALHTLAQANPIHHMNAAFRAVAIDGTRVADLAGNVSLLAALAVAAMLLGARAYRRMLHVERAR
jgi:ABC-2 type transport system permease protein